MSKTTVVERIEYTTIQRWCSLCSRTTTRPVIEVDPDHGDNFWQDTIKITSRCECGNSVIDFHTQKDINNMLAAGILVAKSEGE